MRMDKTDFELLQSFVAEGDEAAFSTVVCRHGAMVRGICERVMGDPAGADDACQATFVMLAVKAPKLSRRRWRSATLGSWLYRVAFNKAIESCRRQQSRRRTEQTFAANRLEAERERTSQTEILKALDQELAALPEEFQSPLVLCHLEGKTQQEAARLLGLSHATIRRRLERGRSLLHSRLARRGFVLSAAVFAALIENVASAAAPDALPAAGELLKAAAAKKLAAAAPTGFARLATAGKFKIAAAALTGIGALAGWQFAAHRPPAEQAPADRAPAGLVAAAKLDSPAAAPHRSIARTMIEQRSTQALTEDHRAGPDERPAIVEPEFAGQRSLADRVAPLAAPGSVGNQTVSSSEGAASVRTSAQAEGRVEPANSQGADAPPEKDGTSPQAEPRPTVSQGGAPPLPPAARRKPDLAAPQSPEAAPAVDEEEPSPLLDVPPILGAPSADLELNLVLHPPPPPRRLSSRMQRRQNFAARRKALVEARERKAKTARREAEPPMVGDEPQDEPQREPAPSPAGVETLFGVDSRERPKPPAAAPQSETRGSDQPK